MRISDWSSDVCSSDLPQRVGDGEDVLVAAPAQIDDDDLVLRHAGHDLFRRRQRMARFKRRDNPLKIGRASWRERVCQYVSISVVAESLKKKQQKTTTKNQ